MNSVKFLILLNTYVSRLKKQRSCYKYNNEKLTD